MSGYIPVSLSLVELRRFDREVFGALMMYLRREWRMKSDGMDSFGRLLFAPDTGAWAGVEPLPETLTTQQLLEEVRWFRFACDLEIGMEEPCVELYVFPGTAPGSVRLEFKLGSRVNEAVYAHELFSGWDEEAKQALLDFCAGVARSVEAEGFVLQRDDGELSPFTVKDAVRRMRNEDNVPVMELWSMYQEGKPINHLRPGKITAVKRRFLPMEELKKIWKAEEKIYEFPPDYVVLDLLQPRKWEESE